MLVLLSPAKTLDYTTPIPKISSTQPDFLDDAEKLVAKARRLSKKKLRELMKISEPLADENAARFESWSRPFTNDNARPAMFAFTGEVYLGLEAASMKQRSITWAQEHLRILSGLYGILRPLDLMQPYRMEMGLPFAAGRAKNLYEFWGDKLTDAINDAVDESGSTAIVNLASNEYFKAVKPRQLTVPVITPQFREIKNGELKMISFTAKKARGTLARHIIDQRLTDPEQLTEFTGDRYKLRPKESVEAKPLFARKFIPVNG